MLRQTLARSALRTSRQSCNTSRAFATTSRRPAEVQLTVDGKTVSIEAGSALIQACEKAGVTIPRYCYHEKLMIAGNCRMCLVEVERAPKPVASCAWPVQPGMVVKTNSPLTHKAREGVMEFLLANHPLDCPICDQGGECDLQDQSMRYGADRGRFHEIGGKRATEDKNIGPLIKTSMNRCIHCTRCIRFANDVAGAPELGSTGRGNDMQIGTYLEKNLDSEMSGNVIDLCPVGALTSKPYAFRARPWELKHSESIDVLDGLGSNIRVDSRGLEVMRILPRINDDVNEEWINDKSRFACDGLKTQRLTTPLIRKDDKFFPATWEQALTEIAAAYKDFAPKGNEFKAIAGELIEVESMVALKDLANKLGSENLALDQPSGSQPIAHGIDVRSNYLFNSKIWGVEEADAILIVGSNPRWEAAGLNARIRKQWMRSDLEIGVVGETWNSTFEFEHLGTDAAALKKALAGPFGKKLQAAKRPMIIVGSGVTDHPDAKAIYEMVGSFVDKNAANFLSEEWNGYNVLQRAASRAGAYEVGFTTPSTAVANTKPKFVWLLGADEFATSEIPKDAFVVYQGHHGDRGAQIADVVLPGAAYTEKAGTYVNTEGRVQMTRAATSLPGAARTDWKIIRAISEFLGAPLPYDDVAALRDRMIEISPALASYDVAEPVALKQLSKVQLVDQNKGSKPSGEALKKVIENFYFTDVISRSSPTMARCSAAKETGNPETNFLAPGYSSENPHGRVAYGP
ncbi:NADH-ubiquinone oxidoreductase 78 kDa subunit mitochondrial precursor [Hyaloscypha bicolor E]|uniref:NADH-ubiquinone oxidoreductase 78 kDa subunit, mitochondrial n=1 Tax=Hyaloscypha bicolor E TaxID=1095630 RepID=A0A2J6SZU5_9HELO|nr:NADH-ubiquinone oxidoreductase 78 kDa subunit mitochondrial precursor [Hyaloscypha bicolor E]PMD56308.1 NADH-ubiquinone oxidoreductase 78 kDa subunit mitochondrial precursor [Hyaloscypha bicolor E]